MTSYGNKKELIELIDLKVKGFESEQQIRGINLWVIWAAIGTMGWMALGVWEAGAPNPERTLLWFLIFSIGMNAVESLKYLNSSKPSFKNDSDRFMLLSPEARILLFAYFIRSFVLIMLFWNNGDFCFWHFWAIYLLASYEVVNALLFLAISYLKLPVLLNQGLVRATDATFLVRLGILIVVEMELFSFHSLIFVFSDLKIGLLLASIYFLLCHVSQMPGEALEALKLKHLQTQIAFDDIDIHQAWKNYADLIKGMTLPGVFKESNETLENLFNQFDRGLIEAALNEKKTFRVIKGANEIFIKKQKLKKDHAKKLSSKVDGIEKATLKNLKHWAAIKKLRMRIKAEINRQIFLMRMITAMGALEVEKFVSEIIEKRRARFLRDEKKYSAIDREADLVRGQMLKLRTNVNNWRDSFGL